MLNGAPISETRCGPAENLQRFLLHLNSSAPYLWQARSPYTEILR